MIRRPPRSPLFPYTSPFRSCSSAVTFPQSRPTMLGRWSSFTERASMGRATITLLNSSPRDRSAHHARSLRSEEHTSELQSRPHLVCRLLLEKKKNTSSHIVY